MFRRRPHRAHQLITTARSRFATGDLPGAIAAYQQAWELLAADLAAHPDDLDLARDLGALCYQLGEWQIRQGAFQDAIRTLDAAEGFYQWLETAARPQIRVTTGQGEGPPQGPELREAQRLIADVALRRGRAHAIAGQLASALVDTQSAVLVYHRQADGHPEVKTEAARVLARAAVVQIAYGDPDLASAAADWSIRAYLERFHRDGVLAIPGDEADSFYLAVGTARAAHAAAGRDQAQWLDELARLAPAAHQDQCANPPVDHVRGLVTLRQVLDRVDPVLAGEITAPPTDVRILVPLMRCPLARATDIAVRLSKLAIAESAGGRDPAAICLALEANALFSGASSAQTLEMRYAFRQPGQVWARLLLTIAARTADSDPDLARDLSGWLARVINNLMPFGLVDVEVAALLVECATWQAGFYRSIGDLPAADRCAQAAQVIGAHLARRSATPDRT